MGGFVCGVGVEDADLAGWTAVDDLEGDAGANGVVEGGDIEIGFFAGRGAAEEGAEEAVGAVDGEVVGVLARGELPEIGEFGAGLDGVGPWAGLGVTGADVKDRSGFADVSEVDADRVVQEVGLDREHTSELQSPA